MESLERFVDPQKTKRNGISNHAKMSEDIMALGMMQMVPTMTVNGMVLLVPIALPMGTPMPTLALLPTKLAVSVVVAWTLLTC